MRFIGQRRPPRSFDVLDGPVSRFAVLSNLDGYDVIDYDGAPVARLASYDLAQGRAEDLNVAHWMGADALAVALTDPLAA